MKYAIRRKKFEILRTFDTLAECDSDDTDEFESDLFGVEALIFKKKTLNHLNKRNGFFFCRWCVLLPKSQGF